jgi:hypothetical protein
MPLTVDALANTLGLGALLDALRVHAGHYTLVDHWQQGEFHHDVVVQVHHAAHAGLPGPFLVVATNCNGGVKEVQCFGVQPDRWALWHARCPDVVEFAARVTTPLPDVLAAARTPHWFQPCELLVDDARSELLPSCRKRAPGGGWEQA